jgi:hypothetical protein
MARREANLEAGIREKGPLSPEVGRSVSASEGTLASGTQTLPSESRSGNLPVCTDLGLLRSEVEVMQYRARRGQLWDKALCPSPFHFSFSRCRGNSVGDKCIDNLGVRRTEGTGKCVLVLCGGHCSEDKQRGKKDDCNSQLCGQDEGSANIGRMKVYFQRCGR